MSDAVAFGPTVGDRSDLTQSDQSHLLVTDDTYLRLERQSHARQLVELVLVQLLLSESMCGGCWLATK